MAGHCDLGLGLSQRVSFSFFFFGLDRVSLGPIKDKNGERVHRRACGRRNKINVNSFLFLLLKIWAQGFFFFWFYWSGGEARAQIGPRVAMEIRRGEGTNRRRKRVGGGFIGHHHGCTMVCFLHPRRCGVDTPDVASSKLKRGRFLPWMRVV